MEYFRVVNLDQYQHYKDRNPPWIKLHQTVLEDYDFCGLPDAQKAHIVLIWLLASRTENHLPMDARWVANKIGSTESVDLDLFLNLGWIELSEGKSSTRSDWSSRYVSKETRDAVFERDENQCQECKSKENLELDHVVPISKGGDGSAENLQVLCRSCNRRKRNKISAEHDATQMRRPETETETETDIETIFDEFWKIYPSRSPHQNPKKPAKDSFLRKVRNGSTAEEILAGARKYADLIRAAKTEPQHVAQAVTFLNQERYKDQIEVRREPKW